MLRGVGATTSLPSHHPIRVDATELIFEFEYELKKALTGHEIPPYR